eukprot:CAMPEP_0204846262 /NCGR_PEP_ID=MMETSP1347-20130617/1846_1 /ASSEMBLY_ACC=CAM_ASM_000690 /TAXON_ID=215587 /ORGANISM="Aplanochytrium stocchinoi, Strain GSBS06" /LENGTH=256 /DNA_ID=CAMNT_0051986741 /DNA_START=133 /DNA_END=904 /DNA_ORIENTATION=+
MILSHTQPTFDSNGLSIEVNHCNYEIEYLDFDRLPTTKTDLLIGGPENLYEISANLEKDWMDTASLFDIVETLDVEPFTPRPTASPIHVKKVTAKAFPITKKRALYSNENEPKNSISPAKKQKREETIKPKKNLLQQKLKTQQKLKIPQKPKTHSKPKIQKPKMETPNQKTPKQTATQQKNKAPRSKWADSDILMLWEGISKHGSEWRVIREFFPGRTYDQIKEKAEDCFSNDDGNPVVQRHFRMMQAEALGILHD